MRGGCDWTAVVRHRVRIGTEVDCQRWMCAALPDAGARSEPQSVSITSAAHFQLPVLSQTLTNQRRLLTEGFAREVVLANFRDHFLFLPAFFRTSIQWLIAPVFAFLMHMVLHTVQNKLRISNVTSKK